jgi:hypothetical protein
MNLLTPNIQYKYTNEIRLLIYGTIKPWYLKLRKDASLNISKSKFVVYHTSEPHSMEVDILSYYLASQSFDRNVLCTKLDTYVFYEQTKFWLWDI